MQNSTKEIVKIIGRLYLAMHSVHSVRTAMSYIADRKFEDVKKFIDDNNEIIETVIRTEARQIELNGEYLIAKSLPEKEFSAYIDEYNIELTDVLKEHGDARTKLVENVYAFIENKEG